MTEPSTGVDMLVSAAVAGDRVAVERLLATIRPLVVRYCRGRVGRFERSFSSADDVAQEVCLAVLRALPGYRDQGRPFLAFVYGIAAHKVADAHRLSQRNKSDPYDEVPDAPALGDGPELVAIQADERQRLLGQTIGRLGPCGVDSLLARSSLGRPQAVTARRRSARHQLDGPAIAMANEILQEADMASRQEPDLINEALPGLSQRTSKLLQELPDRQREILVLRMVVGLSAEETAEVVESTPGAVRVAQHRALSRLRNFVSGELEFVSGELEEEVR